MTFRDAISARWPAEHWTHTVKQAADALGMSESYVRMLSNLERYPAIKMLDKICAELPDIDTNAWRKSVLDKREELQ
ncbi:MAG: helix-turn-helix domain-containing protein [Aeromonadaceae bacterium]